jgi:hypothetical protein
MYIEGLVEVRLEGGVEQVIPPSGFFRGIANLVTEGSWDHCEKVEAVDLLNFGHTLHEALTGAGCSQVVRACVGDRALFENLNPQGDHFAEAMAALDRLAPTQNTASLTLDLVYKAEDAFLSYVIDVSFCQAHQARRPPVIISVRAVPTGLKRQPSERDDVYAHRAATTRVPGLPALEQRVTDFLERIVAAILKRQPATVTDIKVGHRGLRVKGMDDTYSRVAYGQPLYGFDPYQDLAYFWMYNDIRNHRRYGGSSSGYVDSGSLSWSSHSDHGGTSTIGSDAGYMVGDFIGDAIDAGGFDAGDSGGDSDGGGDGGGGDGGGGGD